MLTLCMVNGVLPVFSTYASRPAVAVVGFGKLSVRPAVVCGMTNVVYVSTVAAAVPIAPLAAKSLSVEPVNSVEPLFVN